VENGRSLFKADGVVWRAKAPPVDADRKASFASERNPSIVKNSLNSMVPFLSRSNICIIVIAVSSDRFSPAYFSAFLNSNMFKCPRPCLSAAVKQTAAALRSTPRKYRFNQGSGAKTVVCPMPVVGAIVGCWYATCWYIGGLCG